MSKVHVSIATLPDRLDSLYRVLDSLYDQADKIHVYLNGHDEVPEVLYDDRFDFEHSDVNKGGKMKFWWANQLDGYLLFCDDDIVYPGTYTERVVAAIERYQRQAVVGFHGVTLREPFERYTKDRDVIHFNSGLAKDKPVHILGTGVMGYHSSTMRVSMADFPYRSMSDIWFGIACQEGHPDALPGREHGIPLVCLARPLALFESSPSSSVLWEEKDDATHRPRRVWTPETQGETMSVQLIKSFIHEFNQHF